MRLAIFVVLSAFLCRVTIWPPFPRSCERELRSSSLATDHLSAARLLFQFWPEFAATSAEPVSVGSRSRRIGALALPCHHRLCWRVYKLCISIVRPMRRRVRCDRFRTTPPLASTLPSPVPRSACSARATAFLHRPWACPTSPACCAALGGAPRCTGAKATMLRIETFAPAHRATPPSTCSRLQGMWGQAHGAMTAALVIVPADPVCARSASAHGGRAPGSSVRAVSSRTRPGPREVLSGAPWMVRLSMGCGDETSPARLAPARKHPLGSHR